MTSTVNHLAGPVKRLVLRPGALGVHGAARARRCKVSEADKRRTSREARYLRRGIVRRITKIKRLAGCGRWLNGSPDGGVSVKVSGEGVAHFAGIQTCGSVWACPVCAAKIRQARADELEAGLAAWLAAGHGVEFVTLTVPHRLDQRLSGLFDLVEKGWRTLRSGRAWAGCSEGCTTAHRSGSCDQGDRARFGIAGWVRTIEVTYGASGWHPHVHALLLTEAPLTDEARTALGDALFGRWARYVAGKGGGSCERSAFRIVGGQAGVGRYLTKVQDEMGNNKRLGMEMTRHDLKAARRAGTTPFGLLDHIGDPDEHRTALALWEEWETTTRGRRCLTWSEGARTLLNLQEDEPTDEELAEAEAEGETVMMLTGEQWSRLVAIPGADTGLLDAVERGGAGAGHEYLRRLGIT